MLGALVLLYWLYMGSQSRFYARWMLPLYPALAVLAAYALTLVRQRVVFGVLVALVLLPSLYTTVRNSIVMGGEDTRSETRDWLVANVPQGTKVSFEPIAPTEWYGSTPGGGAKSHPAQQWDTLQPQRRDHRRAREGATAARGAGQLPELRAHAHPGPDRRLPARGRVRDRHRLHAVRPRVRRAPRGHRPRSGTTAALKREADVVFKTDPTDGNLPRYQVDKSFNYVEGAFKRPGPEMIVYRLRDCTLVSAVVNRLVRPLLVALTLLLLVPAAARAPRGGGRDQHEHPRSCSTRAPTRRWPASRCPAARAPSRWRRTAPARSWPPASTVSVIDLNSRARRRAASLMKATPLALAVLA